MPEEKNRKKWYEKCGGSELTDRARLLRDKLKKYQSFFEILDIASTILAMNAIFVFIYYKNLHNTKNWIHVHLFIAVALTGLLRLIRPHFHEVYRYFSIFGRLQSSEVNRRCL